MVHPEVFPSCLLLEPFGDFFNGRFLTQAENHECDPIGVDTQKGQARGSDVVSQLKFHWVGV